jgi:hypothetical protein
MSSLFLPKLIEVKMQALEKWADCAAVPEIREGIGSLHSKVLLPDFAAMKSLDGSSIMDYTSQSKVQLTAFGNH